MLRVLARLRVLSSVKRGGKFKSVDTTLAVLKTFAPYNFGGVSRNVHNVGN